MRAPLATVARVEIGRLVRQPTALVLTGILAVYLVVIGASFYALLSAPSVEGFDRDAFVTPIRAAPLPFAMSLFASTATIALVVLAATIVGHEFSRGTLRTLLLSGVTRRTFVAAKLVALAGVALVVGILGTTFTFAAIAAFSAALGERLLVIDAATVLWTFVGLTVTFYGWASLAASATLWRGSLGVGIGAAVGLLIVGDLASDLLAGMGQAGTLASRILPNAAFSALTSGTVPSVTTWAWVLPSLAAYLVVLPWLALRRLEKMDVVAATRG